MNHTDIFKGKRVLITGGLGFIGANLARKLVELGAYITLVDSLIPEYGGNLFNIAGIHDRVRINISDVRDPFSMKYLVQEQDYLFNLAGQTSHLDSMCDPQTDLDINVRSQLAILESCRRHQPGIKIVVASTRQVYGKPQYLPVDEKHPLLPVDINGINKLAGESYHLLYHNIHGIRTVVLRLTNTIGPCMRIKDARQTFLGIWIRLLIEQRPFEVWGGNQLRDLVFIDDAVKAFLMAAANDAADGKVFNVGGCPPVRLDDLARILVTVNGGGEWVKKTFPAERKAIDIGDYYTDDNHIRSVLGWEPAVALEPGLRRTLAYYQKHYRHYL